MDELMEIARLRFGMIAPVIQETYPDESVMAYCRRVAQTPMRLPDGRIVKYKPKTIGKWVSLYRNGGIDALTPKTRSDLGKTRVLTEEAIDEIYRIKQKYPRLNATQIHARLVQESLIPATVSVATVQRFVKRNGLKSADAALAGRDRKAFEEAYFGGMYQADTCYLPYLEEHGKKHRTYLIMILDDYSRMIVGGQIFYQENAYNFQKVLKDAVAAYGIPDKLYVDSGAPYKNRQLDMICASIGTVLLHTPVRDGASKGKVERNFRYDRAFHDRGNAAFPLSPQRASGKEAKVTGMAGRMFPEPRDPQSITGCHCRTGFPVLRCADAVHRTEGRGALPSG